MREGILKGFLSFCLLGNVYLNAEGLSSLFTKKNIKPNILVGIEKIKAGEKYEYSNVFAMKSRIFSFLFNKGTYFSCGQIIEAGKIKRKDGGEDLLIEAGTFRQINKVFHRYKNADMLCYGGIKTSLESIGGFKTIGVDIGFYGGAGLKSGRKTIVAELGAGKSYLEGGRWVTQKNIAVLMGLSF